MQLTAFEEDMQRAHYFALGALHARYQLTDQPAIYRLATGFAYFYTRPDHMSQGIAKAWDEYVKVLDSLAHDEYMSKRAVQS
jgi:hypothetical protein